MEHQHTHAADFVIEPLDMRSACSHACDMPKMIQIRNVPDDVHRKLKVRAAASGLTLSDFLLRELGPLADRPTMEELRARIASRTPIHLEGGSAPWIRADRDAR